MQTTSGTRSLSSSILKKIWEEMLYGKLPMTRYGPGKIRDMSSLR